MTLENNPVGDPVGPRHRRLVTPAKRDGRVSFSPLVVVAPKRLVGLLVVLALCGAPGGLSAQEPAAVDLIRKVQEMLRSDRMQVIRPDWRREMRMKSWDDRPGKRFFIHVLAPKKEENTTFLKVRGNLWMYLPKLERDIKIPPSMMLNSWMGSDFTNDDLVKSSSVVEDYSHRLLARDGAGDAEVVVIESLPRPQAPVVWGKLVHRVRLDGTPLEEVFFNERGKEVRRLSFEAVAEMGGRHIPTRWIMTSLGKPSHSTVLEIEEIAFDVPIPEATFGRANLSRRR
jgi:hypothetical protein